jgi:hypothetical protein
MSLCPQFFWGTFQSPAIPQTPELKFLPLFDDFRPDMLRQKCRCLKEKTGLFNLDVVVTIEPNNLTIDVPTSVAKPLGEQRESIMVQPTLA